MSDFSQRLMPAKAVDISSSSYTSDTTKKGGLKAPTSSFNIPTSNLYDMLSQEFNPENYTNSKGGPNLVLDDMESEEEVEVVFDEITNLLSRIAPVAIIDRQLHFEYTIASRSTDVMVMALPVLNINHSAFRNCLSLNNLFPTAPPADSIVQVLAQWKAVYDAHNELACLMLGNLSISLIMNGLTSDFAGFVRNYNMHNMRKAIDELHVLLIEYEKGKGKGKGKGKDKPVYIPKPQNPKPSAKEHPEKDDA
ncbi:hypothetical protein Tco_1232906 [Tanacetum coccineum]